MSVSCCSIHPMLPFSNRFSSYEQLNKAFFTVEGQDAAVEAISGLFCSIEMRYVASMVLKGKIPCSGEHSEQSGDCCS